MKKVLIILIATIVSAQAQALITADGDPKCAVLGPLSCAVSTTTSLPTLLIEGQEVDLNTQEAGARLVAEANGNVEKVLTVRLAQEWSVQEDDIVNRVKGLETMGQEVSIRAVAEGMN